MEGREGPLGELRERLVAGGALYDLVTSVGK